MAGIADKFDKAYEDKSLAELADAPVAAGEAVEREQVRVRELERRERGVGGDRICLPLRLGVREGLRDRQRRPDAEDEQRLMQSIHPFALFLENYAEKRDMLGIPKEMLYQILPIINRGADDQPGQ